MKAEGLSLLSHRYEKELTEQKQLFIGMKQIIKEKDLFIVNIQRQVKQRESFREAYIATLKKEMERQSFLIRKELIDQFRLT